MKNAETLPLSVEISALNEVQTIHCKLRDLLKAFTFEIIIVDDGACDETTESIRQLNDERVFLFFIERTRAGGALRTALLYLVGQVVVIQDAGPGV